MACQLGRARRWSRAGGHRFGTLPYRHSYSSSPWPAYSTGGYSGGAAAAMVWLRGPVRARQLRAASDRGDGGQLSLLLALLTTSLGLLAPLASAQPQPAHPHHYQRRPQQSDSGLTISCALP